MRKIPPKLAAEMEADPYYKKCARLNFECDGRITWEHAFVWGGKQINERWAIIPLCTYHHAVDLHQDGAGLNKELNEYIALSRATMGDLFKYPKTDWWQKFKYLHGKYGVN